MNQRVMPKTNVFNDPRINYFLLPTAIADEYGRKSSATQMSSSIITSKPWSTHQQHEQVGHPTRGSARVTPAAGAAAHEWLQRSRVCLPGPARGGKQHDRFL